MTPRERVARAIRRERPDRVPKEAGFTPAALETFRRATGQESPADTFGMEARSVGFRPPAQRPDFGAYLKDMPEGTRVTGEYGTADVPGDFYHLGVTHRV